MPDIARLIFEADRVLHLKQPTQKRFERIGEQAADYLTTEEFTATERMQAVAWFMRTQLTIGGDCVSRPVH